MRILGVSCFRESGTDSGNEDHLEIGVIFFDPIRGFPMLSVRIRPTAALVRRIDDDVAVCREKGQLT